MKTLLFSSMILAFASIFITVILCGLSYVNVNIGIDPVYFMVGIHPFLLTMMLILIFKFCRENRI